MLAAWIIFRRGGCTFSEALTQSWDIQNFGYNVLSNSVVSFTYIKKSDGSVREATGTRQVEVIPAKFQPKGDKEVVYTSAIPYFDFGSMGWRSVSRTQYLTVKD